MSTSNWILAAVILVWAIPAFAFVSYLIIDRIETSYFVAPPLWREIAGALVWPVSMLLSLYRRLS